MKNSKIYVLLKSLSVREQQQLKDFLNSPYFNKNQKPILLLENLLNLLTEDNENNKQDENKLKTDIFQNLYPGEAFDDLKLRHQASELMRLTEEFIATQVFREDAHAQELRIMQFYSEKGLQKHFSAAERRIKDQLEKKAGKKFLQKEEEKLHNNYNFQGLLHNHLVKDNLRSNSNNLQKSLDALDDYFILAKLRLCCEAINYKNIFRLEYSLPLLDEVKAHLKTNTEQRHSAIKIYHKIMNMLSDEESEKNYRELKEILLLTSQEFNEAEARDMHYYALNFCVKQINKGKSSYLKEIFDLYKMMLENGLLLEGGYLSPWNFKNIVVTALRQQEFNWTRSFIETYSQKLVPEFRENATTYNLAKYHFYLKNHKEVVKLLHKVEYEDVFYNLDSKTMLIKTYFELNEIQSLFAVQDSFKTFLMRNKQVSPQHKETYVNFIRFTKKIIDLRPRQKEKIQKLKEQLAKTPAIADIEWLKGKLAELEGEK